MTWVLVIALAAAAFAVLAFAFELPRAAWTTIAATLAFGLAGYAFQGSPGMPGAPSGWTEQSGAELGEQLVKLRRELMAEENWGDRGALITADALTRNGRFEYAATMLGGYLDKNPRNAEGWVALGNALVAHAGGNMTPAAQLAYRKAEALAPDDPAVPFFLGLSELQAFRLIEARTLWAQARDRAVEGSETRALMDQRLANLDELMRRIVEQSESGQGAAPGEATPQP